MPSFLHPGISFSRGTFSIFMAPSHTLSEALSNYLIRQNGSILVLTGNAPVVLPAIRTMKNQWKTKNVTHAWQILTALEDSSESLILIEHDRSLYDEDADLIRPIALMCRRKVSEKGTVFMFGPRPDAWLIKFEPFAHKMVYIEEIIPDYPGKKTDIPGRSWQRTLEGVV